MGWELSIYFAIVGIFIFITFFMLPPTLILLISKRIIKITNGVISHYNKNFEKLNDEKSLQRVLKLKNDYFNSIKGGDIFLLNKIKDYFEIKKCVENYHYLNNPKYKKRVRLNKIKKIKRERSWINLLKCLK